MPKGSPEELKPSKPDPNEHGPLRAERIPRSSYTPKFLNDLKVQKKVVEVAENWDASRAGLSPRVNWVIYPNGDLERIGFD